MGSIKRYMQFVKPYRLQIIATLIIGIIKFAIPLLIPLLIKYLIDEVIINDALTSEEKPVHLGIALGVTAFIFVIIRPPIEYYRQYFAQWTASKILFDIREKLYAHLQRLGLKFYSN
ncbi:ABC transporter transmembrane domain-containing protein, partial [Pallidibacillus pasinlerensis]